MSATICPMSAENRPEVGLLARIQERVGNPLDWDEISKVLVLLGAIVAPICFFSCGSPEVCFQT